MLINLGWMLINLGWWRVSVGRLQERWPWVKPWEGHALAWLPECVHWTCSFSSCLIKNKNFAQLKIKNEPPCLVQTGLGVTTELWVHSPCCVRTLVPAASSSARFQPGLEHRACVPLPAATEIWQEELH